LALSVSNDVWKPTAVESDFKKDVKRGWKRGGKRDLRKGATEVRQLN
jgi:hypothetical protein